MLSEQKLLEQQIQFYRDLTAELVQKRLELEAAIEKSRGILAKYEGKINNDT